MRECKELLNNGKGYTLLSAMMTLAALVVVTTLFSISMSTLKPQINGDYVRKEAIIFTEQLKGELLGATSIQVSSQKLLFNSNNDVVSYSLFHHYVRRQVNGLGNELVLLHIQDISFRKLSNGVEVKITHEDGTIYEALLLIFRTEGII